MEGFGESIERREVDEHDGHRDYVVPYLTEYPEEVRKELPRIPESLVCLDFMEQFNCLYNGNDLLETIHQVSENDEHLVIFTSEFNYRSSEEKNSWVHLHDRQNSEKCTMMCRRVRRCEASPEGRRGSPEKGERALQVCTQCGTSETPLWRRVNSNLVCNACGLYFRTHSGGARPERLFKGRRSVNTKKQFPRQ